MNRYRKTLDHLLSSNDTDPLFQAIDPVIKNTQCIDYPALHKSFNQYVAGNCWYNGKLSYRMCLTNQEKQDSDNIDSLVQMTKPINGPLYLFHGFEPGSLYKDDEWQIGDKIIFPFHLSKTLAHWIAAKFTNHWQWYLNQRNSSNPSTLPSCYCIGIWNAFKTLFIRKYLFCVYEGQSKHISTDARCPRELVSKIPRLIMNEEFEFLSHKNESFELIDVVYKFRPILPFISKYYIIVRIKN